MNKASVRPEVQKFMNDNPVSRIGKGSQCLVYGGHGVVVKSFPPMSKLEQVSEEAGIPGAYNTHKLAKDCLGGLTLPFELAEGIRISVLSNAPIPGNLAGFHMDFRELDRAVVQERSDQGISLDVQLKNACEEGNGNRVAELLRLFIDFRLQLLQRGACLNDPIPDNMVVAPDSKMLLRDIGAVKFATRDQMVRIRDMWWQKLAGPFAFLGFRKAVDRGTRRQMNGKWEEFHDRFMDFYDSQALGRLYPKRSVRRAGKNNSKVPNVKLPARIE